MTTVDGWQTLTADTKITFLLALGVPDSRFCEIKISNLNKEHINETGYYYIYAAEIY